MELGLKLLGPRFNGAGEKKQKERTVFLCEQCSHPFKTTSALKKHVAAVHEKRSDYVCDVCAVRVTWGLLHKIVRFETYLPVGTFPGGWYVCAASCK